MDCLPVMVQKSTINERDKNEYLKTMSIISPQNDVIDDHC